MPISEAVIGKIKLAQVDASGQVITAMKPLDTHIGNMTRFLECMLRDNRKIKDAAELSEAVNAIMERAEKWLR